MDGLTPEQLLRQEALVRAREVRCWSNPTAPTDDEVVKSAERFYAFLTSK